MDFNSFMEKLFKKLSHKNLIVIIVVLVIAILGIIGVYLKNNKVYNDTTAPSAETTSAEQTVVVADPPMVVIDPGHGGWEPGAGSGSVNEKDVVLALSLEIEKQLKLKNIDYLMTRTDDTYVSLEDRVKIANEKKSKLFISIHNNSFSDSSQSGILTTYNPNSPIGKEIAGIMQAKINNIGMKDRETMPRPNLYVLRHTEMPSLLLEIGFISNKKNRDLLTSNNFQEKCAKKIVEGIEEILSKYVTDGGESSSRK